MPIRTADRYVQFTGGSEVICSDCKVGNIKIGAFSHNGIFGHMLLMFSEGIYFVPPLRSNDNDWDRFTYNLYQKIDYDTDKWFTQPHFDLYYYAPPGQIELVWKKKYSEPPEYFSQYYSAPSHMFHITESSPSKNTVVYGDTSVTLKVDQRLEEIEIYDELYSGETVTITRADVASIYDLFFYHFVENPSPPGNENEWTLDHTNVTHHGDPKAMMPIYFPYLDQFRPSPYQAIMDQILNCASQEAFDTYVTILYPPGFDIQSALRNHLLSIRAFTYEEGDGMTKDIYDEKLDALWGYAPIVLRNVPYKVIYFDTIPIGVYETVYTYVTSEQAKIRGVYLPPHIELYDSSVRGLASKDITVSIVHSQDNEEVLFTLSGGGGGGGIA